MSSLRNTSFAAAVVITHTYIHTYISKFKSIHTSIIVESFYIFLDSETFSMSEILQLADPQCCDMWNNLGLGYTETKGLPALRKECSLEYEGNSTKYYLCGCSCSICGGNDCSGGGSSSNNSSESRSNSISS